MTSILLCILALVASFIAGRRSVVAGLGTVFGIGWFYGIIRANLPQAASHFIFDAAVAGLYLAQWRNLLRPAQSLRLRKLQRWLVFLIGWPALLLLVPVQDPLVELVGLRGHIFMLPFFLFGAKLSEEELYRLALRIAGLNLAAFGFAAAEYFIGVDRFFPYREGVTTIIYMSADVAGYAAFRIPATFTNSHAYGGMMVGTIPLLVGAWLQKHNRAWHWRLLSVSLIASIMGVFMAAARTPVIFLFVLLTVATFSGKMKLYTKLGWVMMLAGIIWIVSSDARLQRFTTLKDTDMVTERVYGSVNEGFINLAVRYPMGNGLGGGGTSLPYFLQDRVKERPIVENEYARIMLEQGMPGLCLWVAFLLWAFSRRINRWPSNWELGRRLAWCMTSISFATAFIGTGLLTAIPGTSLILMLLGWLIALPAASAGLNGDPKPATINERPIWAQQYV